MPPPTPPAPSTGVRGLPAAKFRVSPPARLEAGTAAKSCWAGSGKSPPFLAWSAPITTATRCRRPLPMTSAGGGSSAGCTSPAPTALCLWTPARPRTKPPTASSSPCAGWLKDFKLQAYDENTGPGLPAPRAGKAGVRHGPGDGGAGDGHPCVHRQKALCGKLRELHRRLPPFCRTSTTSAPSLVLGERGRRSSTARGTSWTSCGGCRFRISAKSFYQINPVQTEVLYSKAWSSRSSPARRRCWTPTAASATIGLVAAKHGAGQVLGVEAEPDAVKDAIQNAKENAMKKRLVHPGRRRGSSWPRPPRRGRAWDVVFMDPPRAGASGGVPHGPGSLRPPAGGVHLLRPGDAGP